jgi:hypothetical protein
MNEVKSIADVNLGIPDRFRLEKYDLSISGWTITAWEMLFKRVFTQKYGRKFVDQYRSVIPELIQYFSGNESQLLPSDRGIYLFGNIGVGKTVLFETVQELTRITWRKNFFRIFDTARMSLIKDEEEFISDLDYQKPALYDDLGSTPTMVKVYGSDLYPMVEVISARYRLFQRKGVPSFFTSNFSPEELEQEYGTRIVSRLTEMCSCVKISGRDLRR